MKRLAFAMMLSLIVLGGIWLASGQTPTIEVPFNMHVVRFDEPITQAKKQPKIPATWRLVSAEHGSRSNETHLWFQKPTGEVIMLVGFSDSNTLEFILNEYASVIEVAR